MFGLRCGGCRSRGSASRPGRGSVAVAVLVVMASMLGVPVPVMEIVNMVTMLDALMAAALTVDVLVIGLLVLLVLVLLGRRHLKVSIFVGRRFLQSAIYERICNAATPVVAARCTSR